MCAKIKIEDIENFQDSRDGLICNVCGDVATGRHYGAVACNGCKGFFRRTIRRGYKYTCRFQSKCLIDKHNRAVCRFCRYTRCINSGMKVEQVQNERDIIGKRARPSTDGKPSTSFAKGSTRQRASDDDDDEIPKQLSPEQKQDADWEEGEFLLSCLLRSESATQSLRETVIKQTGNVEYTTGRDESTPSPCGNLTATLNDVLKSMHSQLLLVIEWAKTLPPFVQLSTDDQTILLKNFAAQHVTLCVAYRSKDASDVLKLLNDRYIPRASKAPPHLPEKEFYLRDCEKVMDQLVAPMRFLKMDDTEFVALKACVLFNPVAKGLSPAAMGKILNTRRKIFTALEHYIRVNKPTEPTRIGDLTFFVLSPLSTLAQTISEDIMVTKLSGAARIDVLMEELILADNEDSNIPDPKDSSRLQPETPVSSALASTFFEETHYDQGSNHGGIGHYVSSFDTEPTKFNSNIRSSRSQSVLTQQGYAPQFPNPFQFGGQFDGTVAAQQPSVTSPPAPQMWTPIVNQTTSVFTGNFG